MGALPEENPEFTLVETTADGRARRAALTALQQVEVTPTSAVAYRSTGVVAVIGPRDKASTAAARLSPPLRCIVVAQREVEKASTPSSQVDSTEITVGHEKVIQVAGHLGQFAVIVAAAHRKAP